MRENYRKSIASINKFPQFTTMNVIDGQAGIVIYSSLIFYSLTIDNILNIIVLLILAGVSIATLTGEGGILSKANTAKTQTNQANTREQAQIAIFGSYDDNGNLDINQLKTELGKIDKIGTITDTNGEFPVKTTIDGQGITIDQNGNVIVEGDIPIPPKPKSELEEAKEAGAVLDKSNPTTITDTYGNRVKIPEGFKIASDSATDVTGGVVIEDATTDTSGNPTATAGSQFVWIPVGDVYTSTENKEETKETIELGRYVFKEDGSIDTSLSKAEPGGQLKLTSTDSFYFIEGLKDSITTNAHAKDIVTFRAKAIASGGYYIGRYEARSVTPRTSKSNPLEQVTVKPNDYVYRFVTQPQAATLARGMYGADKKFTSDLVNSYAWDTATLFLQTFDDRSESAKKIPYSRQKSFRHDFPASQGTNNLTDSTMQDKICNVWDMANNVREWETETSSKSEYPCTAVGGYRYDDSCVNSRACGTDWVADEVKAFRVVLYL